VSERKSVHKLSLRAVTYYHSFNLDRRTETGEASVRIKTVIYRISLGSA
jgi:hypothetical protein